MLDNSSPTAYGKEVTRMINGFNSRCLQVITKKHFRDTATHPDFNLVAAIRRRRLRYLGHVLRMDPSRLVRRTLKAYVCGGENPPEGSLLMDCDLPFELVARQARNRQMWNAKVNKIN